jgi:hypothetical protein
MPAGLSPAIAARLRRPPPADGVLSRVVTTGRLADQAGASSCVRRVVSAAAARMPREGPWLYDGMLATLVGEMLYSSIPDVRLYAGVAVQATPYAAAGRQASRPAVAAADLLASW